MLRKTLMLIFSLFVLFGWSATAQTADELISKYLQARGGLEKWKAIKTMKTTGKMSMMGRDATFTEQKKRPHYIRHEFTIQDKTAVQAFDGQTAWGIMPFMGSIEPEKLPESDAKSIQEESDFDGPLVDYKEKGHKVELIGKEAMDGKDVYKLKLTLKTGAIEYVYLDSKNFLELKRSTKRKRQGTEYEVDIYYNDYKPVQGVMIPHLLENKVKGYPSAAQVTINKVELNTEIDDSIFKMPTKTQDKPPAQPDKPERK